ncbi:MAG: HypC/HybG/HupF family hydrogenase formation chaperone [Desulfobulbaceae bacterium]|nr:HypC/HybG/HupF family hydrogenase formation chaperone [Desulfobulbaceae bacterium]HIJ79844.1 HypC/HybG/HupF family hydrogenase formation chaperone [Deltaproteobacteria bacterium]
MCLAIPGKVVEVYEENGLKMGRIDYAGSLSKACLAYVPEIEIGQYTVVHAGFALSVIDEDEARKSYEAWQELTDIFAAQGTDIFGKPLVGDDG